MINLLNYKKNNFMDITFKNLRQGYYGNLAERFLSELDFYKIVETIKNDTENLVTLPSENEAIQHDGIVRVYKDENVYTVYCDAIRIVINDNGNENLMQVSLLGNGETWSVINVDSKGKTITDITSPNTKVYTVYTMCNVLLPTGRIIHDIRYTSGTWNEYVYQTTTKMINHILSFNERNKFNKLYDNINNVKNESTDC